MKNKVLILILFFLFVVYNCSNIVQANPSLLSVDYDKCIPNYGVDGDNETWYYLYRENSIGEATITGNYILNSRVTLTIHLNINA